MRPQILGGFDTFVDRKSRAAAAAELPPYRTELERPLDGMPAIGSPWTERLFDGPFYLSPLPLRAPDFVDVANASSALTIFRPSSPRTPPARSPL